MKLLKKGVFLFPALLFLALFLLQLQPFLESPSFMFSLDSEVFIQLIILSIFLLLSSTFWITFMSISQDNKLVITSGAIASALSFLLSPSSIGLLIAVGIFVSILLTSLLLQSKLKNYLTFEPTTLLNPAIRRLTFLVLLTTALGFYLVTSEMIEKQGFQIPDSLIEQSLKFAPQMETMEQGSSEAPPLGLSSITPEQLKLLRQNPQALKQFGLDPKILDDIEKQQKPSGSQKSFTPQDIMKSAVKSQFQSLIDPYISYIPPLLTLLFFFSLQSVVSLLSLFLSPLVWLVFYLLEKTGFTRYELETRQVKKLIV